MKNFILLPLLFLYLSLNIVIAQSKSTLIVGGKNFTEQYLLARMTNLVLKKNGYNVKENLNLKTRLLRKKLISGKIDIYWEYTGTAYRSILKQSNANVFVNSQKLFDSVKFLDAKNGIVWLDRAPLDNSFVLMISKLNSKKYGIHSISDLADKINKGHQFKFGLERSFVLREDGFIQLSRIYGFKVPFNDIKSLDHRFSYAAINSNKINVGLAYNTNGQILKHDVTVLKDDKNYFPKYNPAPTIKHSTLKKIPNLNKILSPISTNLTSETIRKLNMQVDYDNQSIQKVASNWLKKIGALK